MNPWKYFFSTKTKKEVTKLKEGCFHKGRFPYSCNLPRLWNTLELMPLNAQETALNRKGTSPTT
jgi:hypothetical protein